VIGRYALTTDDHCRQTPPTVVASAEDPEYPAVNLIRENPANPAKLTDTDGNWVLTFPAAVSVAWAALLYHNIDEGVPVTLEWNSSDSWGSPAGSMAFDIPAIREDGLTQSPWIELSTPQNYQYWRLVVGAGSPNNSQNVSVGRLMLLGALRDLGDPLDKEQDVRWGVVEEETQIIIVDKTEGGVDLIADVFAPRRLFVGELALEAETTTALLTLFRSAHRRVYPWALIPDAAVNEVLIVRFMESGWSRTRETVNHNIFPFRVQEMARGLPWP
jgi:hypothetical protein